MHSYKHFLITRFNLKVEAWKTTKNAEEVRTEEWLKNRFELFETYCLPSVVNQSNQDFEWYVFFDVDTPEYYRKKVDDIAATYKNFKPLYIDGLEALVGSVTQEIGKDTHVEEFIITTRLDNDDIIHKDFIETIQESFVPVHNTVIDLREGYQVSIDKNKTEIREYAHPFNAFISVIERSEEFKTILSQMHYDWAKSNNIVVFDKKRVWIELVHQKNKMNATIHSIPKIYELEYEAFCLKKSDFNLENTIAIFVSNMILDTRKSFVLLLKSNKQLENFARKIKGLIS